MNSIFGFQPSDGFILFATLTLLIVLVILIGPKAGAKNLELNKDAGYKQPMFAFEMNAGAAPQMFKHWDKTTRDTLRTALLWDFLFIFIYPTAIATACFIAARFLDSNGIIPFKYSLIVIVLQLVAAGLDAVENFALLKVLAGAIVSPWPQIARWCAFSKFSLAFFGLGYAVFVGGGAWLFFLIRNAAGTKTG